MSLLGGLTFEDFSKTTPHHPVPQRSAWPSSSLSACSEPPRMTNHDAKWWRQSWNRSRRASRRRLRSVGFESRFGTLPLFSLTQLPKGRFSMCPSTLLS